MDILVSVPDNKVEFFMELVQNLKFKAEPTSKPKKNHLRPSSRNGLMT